MPDVLNTTENACQDGYSLCMYDIIKSGNDTSTKATVLGSIGGMDFKNNLLMFPQAQSNKIATITLECTPEADSSVLYAPLEKIDIDQVVS